MSRFFETTRHIGAPAGPVWEVLFDVARWARVRQPKLPPALWEVTEVVDGRSFTWEARGPGMRTIARHQVVPDATGSEVTLSIEQTGPMGAVAALVWRRLTQRYIELEAECVDKRVTDSPAA